MFRTLQCPSSGARQTAVAASGFRMNVEVEVFSAVVGLLFESSFIKIHKTGAEFFHADGRKDGQAR
jgi:hypothetical protein